MHSGVTQNKLVKLFAEKDAWFNRLAVWFDLFLLAFLRGLVHFEKQGLSKKNKKSINILIRDISCTQHFVVSRPGFGFDSQTDTPSLCWRHVPQKDWEMSRDVSCQRQLITSYQKKKHAWWGGGQGELRQPGCSMVIFLWEIFRWVFVRKCRIFFR